MKSYKIRINIWNARGRMIKGYQFQKLVLELYRNFVRWKKIFIF